MKQYLTAIFLLINAVAIFGQTPNDDSHFFDFSYDKEKIKINKVQKATVYFSFENEKWVNKTTYDFDTKGILKKMIVFGSKGEIKQEIYFQANENGDLISRIGKNYELKLIDTVRFFKEYKDDKLIKDSSNGLPVVYNYKYSTNGFLIKTIIVSNFGWGNTSRRVINFKLDSLNRIANCLENLYQNVNDSIGSILSDRVYVYNENGRVINEIENINSENSLSNYGTITYQYDTIGNVIQILRSNAASYFYTYDDNGLVKFKKMVMKLESDNLDKATSVITYNKFEYTFRK